MPQEYAQISAASRPPTSRLVGPGYPRGGTAAAVPGVGIDHEGDFLYFFALTFGQGPLADAGRVSAYLRPVQPIQAFPLAPTDPTSIPAGPDRAAGGYRCRIGARAGTAPCADARATRVFPDPEHQSRSNDWVVDASHSATGTRWWRTIRTCRSSIPRSSISPR